MVLESGQRESKEPGPGLRQQARGDAGVGVGPRNRRSETAQNRLHCRTVGTAGRRGAAWSVRPSGLAPHLPPAAWQEVTTMALDMTAQLIPMVWGMVALMVVSSAALLLSHQ